jgi:MoaA/NifB/PqqE/SkfB family radical SAM enzyme
MHDTRTLLANSDFPAIFRKPLEILQVNLGYLCNLSCVHCHVNAGPKRTESLSRETIEQVLALAEAANIHTLDLTGGAPEMHPDFRYLVRSARDRGIVVIDRCNLTILEAPSYEDLAGFLAAQQVQINASLPCYLEENVDNLMCLDTVSIDWQGYVYDCDFNQMLAMPVGAVAKPKVHISELSLERLKDAPIATAAHCYGCTAGQGSSCGGALADAKA